VVSTVLRVASMASRGLDVGPKLGLVPLYEYRCRTCDDRFELRRPMVEADAPASCPAGHAETVRLLAAFAATGRATAAAPMPAPAGGPCGGACACYPGE
jgi:putative FmdB family regulatory protein